MSGNAWGNCAVCGRSVSLHTASKNTTAHGLYKPMCHKRERKVGKGLVARTIKERCPGCDVPIRTQHTDHKIERGEPLEEWRTR